MSLTRLQIQHVRNLQQVNLENLRQINVLYGSNGSGKTSVLEAIHLLGMARSFRGSSVKSLISHGEQSCVSFGRVSGGTAGASVTLGVKRTASGEAVIKVAGAAVRAVAQLAEHLPLQVINADSFELLTGSPNSRRQYLDWGVFHVEHQFFHQWQTFQRCIKQRNKLLRRGKIADRELSVWTRDLAVSGEAISDQRQRYFGHLLPYFSEISSRLAPSLTGLELRYRMGWDQQVSYKEALENNLEVDREHGYTHVGPQRADIRVLIQGRPAADVLSRGQQKLVVCALKLAQGRLLTDQGKRQCTYLLDDLPSELDLEHSRLICQELAHMNAQIFITCVDERDISGVWPDDADPMAVFHVEHGAVQPSGRAA